MRRGAIYITVLICLPLAAQVPIKERMELLYEGTARIEWEGTPKSAVSLASVRVIHWVKSVTETGVTIASTRLFRYRPVTKEEEERIKGLPEETITEMTLRLLHINPEGREALQSPRELRKEVFDFFFARNFWRLFPYHFLPSDRMKEGVAWAVKTPVVLNPPLEGELTYHVVDKGAVDGLACWVIQGKLSDSPLQDEEGLVKVKTLEVRMWVDAGTGLVRRVQRSLGMEIEKLKGLKVRFSIELTLKSTRELDEVTFSRNLTAWEALRTLQGKLVSALRASPIRVGDLKAILEDIHKFRQKFKGYPYLRFVRSWEMVAGMTIKRAEMTEKQKKQKGLVGRVAPDFELLIYDKTKKVRLSDLRGKVVILNFFAHW